MRDANLCSVSGPLPAAVNHKASEQERDAAADLAMWQASTPGKWVDNGNEIVAADSPKVGIAGAISEADTRFIVESHEALPYYINRCVAAESKPSFEDIVREVEPTARLETDRYVFPGDWQIGCTLAQAQEVAAAIVAHHGGFVETEHYKSTTGSAGVVRVWLGGQAGKGDRVVVVFTEEVAAHAL